MVPESTIFWKKRLSFQWKKNWLTLSHTTKYHKAQKTPYEGILHFLCKLRFFSKGRKRSFQTNNSKKVYLPFEEIFWPVFSRIIECDGLQGTNCKGPKGNLTNTFEGIKSFPQQLRGRGKQKFLNKKAIFPVEKTLSAFFVLSKMKNDREQNMRVQKVIWHLLRKL